MMACLFCCVLFIAAVLLEFSRPEQAELFRMILKGS
jgi:hypothetical protein